MKHVSESERLLQATLNKKYMEIEELKKVIHQLQKEKDCLNMRIREYKDCNVMLCKQIAYLFSKHNQNA